MNPLKPDDPRHVEAVEAIDSTGEKYGLSPVALNQIIDAYFASLTEQGVAVVEAYAGDDAGR